MAPVTTLGTHSIPPELVEAASSGHLIVLVGETASLEAGIPSWAQVIQQLRDRALELASPEQRKELAESADWLGSAGESLEKAAFLGQVMGDAWLTGALASIFRDPSRQPAPLHHALSRLPRAAFMTTNYDRLLEQALETHLGKAPQVVLINDVGGLLGFGSGQVLKLHGDSDRPETLVLSTEDYSRIDPLLTQAWRKRLEAMLQPPHQLLLVGHGYWEAHFQDSLHALRAVYGGRFAGPFWLVKEDARARAIARNYGLRPLWLAEHSEATRWLEQLATETEERQERAPAVLRVEPYAEMLWERFKGDQEQAGRLFAEGRYAEALAAYEKILEQATSLLQQHPQDERYRRTIASCRLNIGLCQINLQNISVGRALLREVAEQDQHSLKPESLAVLSHSLALVGELPLARAVLPSSGTIPLADETRQLLDILSGNVPKSEPTSPVLRAHTLRLLLEKGRVDEAAQQALSLLAAAGNDALLLLDALGGLNKALRRSVLEDETAERLVSLKERAALVEALEQNLPRLEASIAEQKDASFRNALRLVHAQIKLEFFDLVRHESLEEAVEAFVREWGPQALGLSDDMRGEHEAQELAASGKLEEAFQRLPSGEASWQEAFMRAHLVSLSGRSAQALDELLALSRQWPAKAPIEYLTAALLLEASRPQEALSHAQVAFDALPGYGYRLLLGRCLLACGQSAEAARVLEPLSSSGGPQALLSTASALEQVEPPRGLELWERYLSKKPEDIGARLQVARLRFQLGRHEEAAEQGWKLFQEHAEQLDARKLYACAQLVLLRGALDEGTKERVRQIALELERRFPNSPEAEEYRFHLAAALGFPGELKPIDFQGLSEAGIVRTVSEEEARSMARERRQFTGAALHEYLLGQLPFEALCEHTGTEAAVFVTRVMAASEGMALCPPIALTRALPVTSLTGQQLLVGELELLLLQHLGLLSPLRKALGEKGRLLLFDDVWERMERATSNLGLLARRAELGRKQELLELLLNSDKVKLDKERSTDTRDDAWAAERGLPLIDADNPRQGVLRLSPLMLAREMREQGLLDRSRAERLEGRMPAEAAPALELPRPLPARAAISHGALLHFFHADALRELLQLFPDGLVIGPATWHALTTRHAELQNSTDAARLAANTFRAVGAGLAEGWIHKRPRPTAIPDLPSPRQSGDAALRQLLEMSLGFRQALVEQPNMWLLTADFFTVSPLGAQREWLRELDWPSAEAFQRLASRMRDVTRRVVSFPALVRHLLGDSSRGALETLARAGFTDALEAEEILTLAREYPGLDASVPRQLLDQLERMARMPEHVNAAQACLRLAGTYAEAFWKAFNRSPTQEQTQARALAATLLGRAEALGQRARAPMLDLLLYSACLLAVENWKDAFVRTAQGYTLSQETRPAAFWAHLHAWSGTNGTRYAAFGRAMRKAWLSVDEQARTDAQKEVFAAPLILATGVAPTTLLAPELQPLVILSATWGVRPLSRMRGANEPASTEELLQRLADSLRGEEAPVLDEARFALQLTHEDGTKHWQVAPPEAVLLRSAAEGVRRWAPELARHQGPHDGRAHALLMQLAQAPEDETLRRRYARLAVNAPWRLIREEPTLLRIWGWRGQFGERSIPGNLQDLRDMLSEPHEPLGSRPLPDVLHQRLTQEDGAWRRNDWHELLKQACAIPGSLPAVPLFVELPEAVARPLQDVRDALRRLAQPEAFPAALLAGDIYLLRVAAAHAPHIELPEGRVDLRDILPDRLLGVIQSALNPAPPMGSLAAAEPSLLRLCMEVVGRLAEPKPLPMKEGLWLTFRLYQWLWAQLETLAPDARGGALRALSEAAPPPTESLPSEMDLLHPLRFGPGHFDYRLATLLYAFSAMEVLPRALSGNGEEDLPESVSVSSTALEELLAGLAARPLTVEERTLREHRASPSVLEWLASGSIPELALEALLVLNPTALLQVPEERRLQWIQDLPSRPEQPGRLRWELAKLLLGTLAILTRRLSPAERVAYEARLRALDLGSDSSMPMLYWMGLTGLYEAGQEELEAEVRTLLLANLSSLEAPRMLGRYLLALSTRTPERLQSEAEEILTRVEQTTGLDPILFAGGVAVVAALGERPGVSLARDLLKKLSSRPPYQGKEQIRSLLGTLGML